MVGFEWFMHLSSGVRWALLALGIALFLFVLEGVGMLSAWAKGHPKRQKLCFWAAMVILAVTITCGIIWLLNPTIDNTPSQLEVMQNQLSDIQETLKDIKDILKLMQGQGEIR